MGKPNADARDMAIQAVETVLTAAGQVGQAASFSGAFMLFISGTFSGSVSLEVSYDGGVTFVPMTALGGAVVFTGRCAERLQLPELGLLVRPRCAAWTSGSIKVRLSQ